MWAPQYVFRITSANLHATYAFGPILGAIAQKLERPGFAGVAGPALA
jgi:hypothetical protein